MPTIESLPCSGARLSRLQARGLTVRLMVLVVVDLHGELVNVGLEGVVLKGKGGEGVGAALGAGGLQLGERIW